MKIRIKTNLGTRDFPGKPWLAGEEHEVDDSVGALLVSRGVAEDLSPVTTEIVAPIQKTERPQKHGKQRGVSDKPSIATPQPPAVAGDDKKPEE